MNWLYLLGIILLGIVTSYTDIRYHKIRNKVIIIALLYALVLNIIHDSNYLESIINFMFAAFIGYLFWDLGLWTPGDGKLFTAYAAIVPIQIYNELSYVPLFPSINILINSFVPAFLVLGFILVLRTPFRQKRDALMKSLRPRIVLNLTLSIIIFSWVVQKIPIFRNLTSNIFVTIFVTFVVLSIVERLLSKKIIFLLIAVAILRLVIDKSVYQLGFITMFLVIFVVFILLRVFVIELGYNFFSTIVKVKDLKPGMVLLEKERKPRYSFYSYLKDKSSAEHVLTAADIKRIQAQHKKVANIGIKQTVPFAPIICIGVILTLIFGGNFLLTLAKVYI